MTTLVNKLEAAKALAIKMEALEAAGANRQEWDDFYHEVEEFAQGIQADTFTEWMTLVAKVAEVAPEIFVGDLSPNPDWFEKKAEDGASIYCIPIWVGKPIMGIRVEFPYMAEDGDFWSWEVDDEEFYFKDYK